MSLPILQDDVSALTIQVASLKADFAQQSELVASLRLEISKSQSSLSKAVADVQVRSMLFDSSV